jgi:hypothetical protein
MVTTADDALGQVIAQLVRSGVSEHQAEGSVLYAFHLGVDAGLGVGWRRGLYTGLICALFWSGCAWVIWG